MEGLKRSLREAPVVDRDGYPYLVHPVTDGIPLVSPDLLREVAAGVAELTDLARVEKIVTPEAMGIHHATAVALEADVPFVVVRKRSYGLDGEVAVHQETGYAEGDLYINGVRGGDRVLFLDDVYSTGGTLEAVCSALVEIGAVLEDVVVVLRRTGGGTGTSAFDVKSLLEVDVVDGEVVVSE